MRNLVSEKLKNISQEPSISEKEILTSLIYFINLEILEFEKCKSFVKYFQGKEGIEIPDDYFD